MRNFLFCLIFIFCPVTQAVAETVSEFAAANPGYGVVEDNWLSMSKPSVQSDRSDVLLFLFSNPQNIDSAVLAPRCLNNTTSLLLDFAVKFAEQAVTVEYAIADGQTGKIDAVVSEDGTMIKVEKPIPLFRNMLGKTSITLRIAAPSVETVEETFDLRGMKAALAPLQKACNWQ